jgi:hypothetical protein
MKRMQSQLDTLKAEREEVDVRALATLANRTEALATKLETGAP